jgi:hypothetical protein
MSQIVRVFERRFPPHFVRHSGRSHRERTRNPEVVARDSGFAPCAPRNDVESLGNGDAIGGARCRFAYPTKRPYIRVLAAHRARVFMSRYPPGDQRAQGRPGAGCTHGHRAERVAQMRVDRQVQPRHPDLPCAVVYGLYALSSVNQRLPPLSAQCASIVANLAPAWARQDHTTSPSARIAARLSAPSRPPHPAPRFVTTAIRPSCRGGMPRTILKIRILEKRNIFAKEA